LHDFYDDYPVFIDFFGFLFFDFLFHVSSFYTYRMCEQPFVRHVGAFLLTWSTRSGLPSQRELGGSFDTNLHKMHCIQRAACGVVSSCRTNLRKTNTCVTGSEHHRWSAALPVAAEEGACLSSAARL
jgi:hypothetical protein